MAQVPTYGVKVTTPSNPNTFAYLHHKSKLISAQIDHVLHNNNLWIGQHTQDLGPLYIYLHTEEDQRELLKLKSICIEGINYDLSEGYRLV